MRAKRRARSPESAGNQFGFPAFTGSEPENSGWHPARRKSCGVLTFGFREFAMSNDLTLEAPLFKGEKISIDSPLIARESAYLEGLTASFKNVTPILGGGLPVFCGAIAVWAAPALLLTMVSLSQLFTALADAPLHASLSHLLILLSATAYFVAAGLLLGWAAERLAPRSRWRRAMAHLVAAPMILLSLAATAVVSVPLFLGVIVLCFPPLL